MAGSAAGPARASSGAGACRWPMPSPSPWAPRLFGLYFFLSLYIQQVNGYSALRGGLAYLPAGLATLAAAPGGHPLWWPGIGPVASSCSVPSWPPRGLLLAHRPWSPATATGRISSAPGAGRHRVRPVLRAHDDGGHGGSAPHPGGPGRRADQHHPPDRRGGGPGRYGDLRRQRRHSRPAPGREAGGGVDHGL